MPYVVNNSRNQIIAVVQDGTINTTATSQTLVGKNVTPYGEYNVENLVHQLENFANATPPGNPIQGQLWYDTGLNILKVYTIANGWKPVSGTVYGPAAPTSGVILGDLWFDPVNQNLKVYSPVGTSFGWIPVNKVSLSSNNPTAQVAGELYFNTVTDQLFVWDGIAWNLIGPEAVANYGTTRWTSTTLSDNSSNPQPVMLGQINGTVVAIVSNTAFTILPGTAPAGFSTISQGMNLSSSSVLNGKSTSTDKLATPRTINGVAFDGTSNITVPIPGSLTPGAYINGAVYNGSANLTWDVNASTSATSNTLVARDTSGNINVNTVIGNLFGSVSGNSTNVSGVVQPVNGGTGFTSYQAGQILIGTGSGLARGNVIGTSPISVSTAGNNITIGFTGTQNPGTVTSIGVINGAGIGVSGSPVTTSGNITITNTGVTQLNTGSGLSADSVNGNITLTNTGVLQLLAGSGITLSPVGGNGTVTVSAIGSTGGAVLVDAFGAVGDGITNDSAAFQAAINSLGATGGRVLLSANKKYRIGSNITLNPSCHLQGQQNMIGSNGYNFYTNYDAIGSALYVDNSATITMRSGSSISHMLIKQRSMTYVSPTSFAGTAITIVGQVSGVNAGNTPVVGDDVTIYDVMIMGFNQAVSATNAQRLRITQCNLDNINGILIDAAYDVPYIDRVHCWPFATIAAVATGVAPNINGADLMRTGTAFKFQNTVDWGKITDCFTYGYFRGYWIDSCNSCVLIGCGADNTPEAKTQGYLGFVVSGGSTDTILTNCQAASHQKGFYINSSVNNISTQMINCVAWFNQDHGVQIDGGEVVVIGGVFRNSANGITVTNALTKLVVESAKFRDISSKAINSTTTKTYLNNCDFTNFTGSSPVTFFNTELAVAATVLDIPNEGDFFVVTTTTTLTTLRYGWIGRRVTLKFNGNTTVTSAGGSPSANQIYLSGGSNFAAVNRSTLTLVSDGTYWYEVGRKV